eukprot:6484868-Pyramimonas_sp.AAC.1
MWMLRANGWMLRAIRVWMLRAIMWMLRALEWMSRANVLNVRCAIHLLEALVLFALLGEVQALVLPVVLPIRQLEAPRAQLLLSELFGHGRLRLRHHPLTHLLDHAQGAGARLDQRLQHVLRVLRAHLVELLHRHRRVLGPDRTGE